MSNELERECPTDALACASGDSASIGEIHIGEIHIGEIYIGEIQIGEIQMSELLLLDCGGMGVTLPIGEHGVTRGLESQHPHSAFPAEIHAGGLVPLESGDFGLSTTAFQDEPLLRILYQRQKPGSIIRRPAFRLSKLLDCRPKLGCSRGGIGGTIDCGAGHGDMRTSFLNRTDGGDRHASGNRERYSGG